MSKVTSKRQVTIPKEVADRYGIEAGDEIEWIPAGDEIRVIPPGAAASRQLGTGERLALFDRATARRDLRAAEMPREAADGLAGRGWTRDDLYDRDGRDRGRSD